MEKQWVEKHTESENGMHRFNSVQFLDYENRHLSRPLASFSTTTLLFDEGMVSVTLTGTDGNSYNRKIRGDERTARAICEAHLRLNLGYIGNAAPGRAIWKPLYTGD
jgi:hypothetical protein